MKNGAWEYPLRSLSGFSGFWRSPIRKGSKCHSGCSFSSFLHSPSFLSKHNSGIVFYLFCCFWKLKLIVQNRIVISTFYASNERTDDSSRTNPQHGMLLCAASDIKDIHPLRPTTNMRYLWAWFWEQRRCQRGEQGAAPTEILAPGPHLHAPLPAVRLHALTGTVRSVSDPDVYWLSSVGNKHSYSCVQNTDRISEYISVCHWTVLLVSGMLLAVVFDYAYYTRPYTNAAFQRWQSGLLIIKQNTRPRHWRTFDAVWALLNPCAVGIWTWYNSTNLLWQRQTSAYVWHYVLTLLWCGHSPFHDLYCNPYLVPKLMSCACRNVTKLWYFALRRRRQICNVLHVQVLKNFRFQEPPTWLPDSWTLLVAVLLNPHYRLALHARHVLATHSMAPAARSLALALTVKGQWVTPAVKPYFVYKVRYDVMTRCISLSTCDLHAFTYLAHTAGV